MEKRERLGSRLGFILLSAGCAIGCGNVWKFPWMCGQYGGGAFVVLYLLFLIILGLPVMTIEFSLGRAAQQSPVKMYQVLEPRNTKWHIHGKAALLGNFMLMMFYTNVTGWIGYYFVKSLSGKMVNLTPEEVSGVFDGMMASPAIMLIVMAIVVILGFVILSFGVQKGLERVTKYMMVALLLLMFVLAINSFSLSGAVEGLQFYLVPDFSKINFEVVVGAMNQAFFTLSLGIGSMAIFGSYIGKDHALMSESRNIIILDTVVAIVAGLIIFPACFTYGVEPGAGPALLFIAMANTFSNMPGGRIWGTIFFLFMFFAAMSTVLAVFENIVACVSEMTGYSRKKTCLICCFALLILAAPCALGFNVLSSFQPLKAGNSVLDLEDFIVSNCLLPIGSLVFVLFVAAKKRGWGWKNFTKEANAGSGMKVRDWMRPYICYILPLIIMALFVIGIVDYFG